MKFLNKKNEQIDQILNQNNRRTGAPHNAMDSHNNATHGRRDSSRISHPHNISVDKTFRCKGVQRWALRKRQTRSLHMFCFCVWHRAREM